MPASSDDPAPTLERVAEVMVYAPIGLATVLIEDGPAAVQRARLELRNARFIGEMAVTRGVTQLRRRFDELDASVAQDSQPASAPAGNEDVADRGQLVEAVSADDLALPDYDSLPAIDIVDKLEDLSADERAAIREYETAGRQRRTILGKLDQIDEQSP